LGVVHTSSQLAWSVGWGMTPGDRSGAGGSRGPLRRMQSSFGWWRSTASTIGRTSAATWRAAGAILPSSLCPRPGTHPLLRMWSMPPHHRCSCFLPRLPKQCRDRYINKLDPNIRKDAWTDDEDKKIVAAQSKLGNRWAKISKYLDGRSETAIKSRWYQVRAAARARRLPMSAAPPNAQSLCPCRAFSRGRTRYYGCSRRTNSPSWRA